MYWNICICTNLLWECVEEYIFFLSLDLTQRDFQNIFVKGFRVFSLMEAASPVGGGVLNIISWRDVRPIWVGYSLQFSLKLGWIFRKLSLKLGQLWYHPLSRKISPAAQLIFLWFTKFSPAAPLIYLKYLKAWN